MNVSLSRTTTMRFPILLLALLAAPSGQAQGAESVGEPEHQTLFASGTDGVACYRIPALVTAPNGDLIAAVDERVPSCADVRDNRDINVVIRRSQDGGRTWSEIETVVDLPPGQSASDPSLIVDRVAGTVFMVYNVMDLDVEPRAYRFHVRQSDDDGLTWSAPTDITAQVTKPSWADDFQFVTSGRGVQTRSGTLLHTLVNLDEGVFVFGSDDHGASWFLVNRPLTPGDESKVVELDDGTWLVNSRVAEVGMRYSHRSEDQGATWQTRREPLLPDPGSNASIVRFSSTHDGDDRSRLLFANANSPERRENLTVRVSTDEGETWPEGRTVYAGPAAYSSLTVLDGGDVGVLFEKDGYAEVAFVRLSLAWLTEGEDRRDGGP